MIKITKMDGDILQVTLPHKIKREDFPNIEKDVDAFIAQNKQINVLIDASAFSGWEDKEAFKNHMHFVKEHHHKIARLALIAAHEWQHWFAHGIGIFIHPEIKAFNKDEMDKAIAWLSS